MRESFLRELECELRSLEKKERKKYIRDYEEIIFDKMENGISEKDAVSGLGNVKEIAEEIIQSHVESDIKIPKGSEKRLKVILAVFDAAAFIVSFFAAYGIYFIRISQILGGAGTDNLRYLFLYNYSFVFLCMALCYLIFYFVFRLYTVKSGKSWTRIMAANTTGVMLLFLILFITKQIDVSRSMIIMFLFINSIIEITGRNIIYYLLKKNL